ncbi:cytochrome P450 2J2-like isoform 2-T2 [Polymixia lowei]
MDSFSTVSGSYVWHWVDVQSLFLFTAVFLVIADYTKNRRPSNYPPGPRTLPFLGNIFTLDFNRTHENLTELAEKYGDVYSLRMGQTWMVVLNGFTILKDALVTKGDALADRPIRPLLEIVSHSQGKPFNPHLITNNAVSNIICSLVFGHRFQYDNERFVNLMRKFETALQIEGSIWAQLYNAFPLLMRPLPGPHQTLQGIWNEVKDFIRAELKEHKKDWDPSEPRDYIDCYLTEIQTTKGNPETTFDEDNLVICTMDLFVAGSETTSTTLRWAFLYMAKYPEIQEKVQAEIDRGIGQSRQPCMADRANLPYTDAVIHEIQRIGNIVPLSLPRITNRDIQLGDYTVPKGVTIITNLTSVLFDKKEWETPFTFNPGHFLNEEGKFMKRAAFIPFSAGKRVCPGENLARMELFLFFTSFMQRFTFSMPAGVKPLLDYRFGLTLAPVAYEICATPRVD